MNAFTHERDWRTPTATDWKRTGMGAIGDEIGKLEAKAAAAALFSKPSTAVSRNGTPVS